MKQRNKYLFKNTFFLFIGTFSSKILVFLLVPIYTSVLSTTDYGIYDLVYSTIQMIIPILSLNIMDGIMRFTLEAKTEDKKDYITVGLKYILFSILIFVIGFSLYNVLFKDNTFFKYQVEIILMYASCIIYQTFIQFARGLDKVKEISIAGVISTAVMITLNVLFLLVFKWGLVGYFYANSLALFFPSIFLFFSCKLYKYFNLSIFKIKPTQHEKEMISYALPLIFTTLSWYINGVADRYAITYFCGLDANGVYSVAFKIPAILNAVQTIFIQAWQLSAIKEYKGNKNNEFFTDIYRGCNYIMIILSSGLIIFTRIISKILFANEFYMAWVFVPTLIMYVIFNTLSGVLGGIFTAVKDKKFMVISAISGAVTNIILNIIFVYKLGPIGAAIATLISSVVIWLLRYVFSRKFVIMKLNLYYDSFLYIILLSQAICMTMITDYWGYAIQAVLFIVLVVFVFISYNKNYRRKKKSNEEVNC